MDEAGCHSEQRGFNRRRVGLHGAITANKTKKVLSCATCVEKVDFLPQSVSSNDTKEVLENHKKTPASVQEMLSGSSRVDC